MKFKSLFFAACAILLAVGGTFATVAQNNVPSVLVYYINNSGFCVSEEIETTLCFVDDEELCLEDIQATGDQRQIYADILDVDTCKDPYERDAER